MHCSSSGGGGGGGGDPAVYTCTNGTPSEGSPDGTGNVESCASCNAGYTLVDGECSCTPGDTVLLSSTLTAGTGIVSAVTSNGYIAEEGIGSLSPDSFSDKGSTYQIQSLITTNRAAVPLIIRFGSGVDEDIRDAWTLEAGGNSYAFKDASCVTSSDTTCIWDNPGYAFPASGDVTVKLLKRITCP